MPEMVALLAQIAAQNLPNDVKKLRNPRIFRVFSRF